MLPGISREHPDYVLGLANSRWREAELAAKLDLARIAGAFLSVPAGEIPAAQGRAEPKGQAGAQRDRRTASRSRSDL